MPTTDARAQAAILLAQVMQGKSLTGLLQSLDHPEKSFVQALCFGVLRHYFSLQWLLQQLLHKAPPKKDNDIVALLLIGLYQLQDETTKDHAAINETVSAVKALRKISYKGLTNAILRNFQRKKTTLLNDLAQQNAHYECPEWLIEQLKTDWPERWQNICEAQQKPPPMTLRVNLDKNSREEYLTLLKKRDIAANALACATAVELEKPRPVAKLPGFDDAAVSVQDQAGQFIPSLLKIKADMRILDACSAPGSKLAHFFETCSQASFTAVELDGQRAKRLQATVERHSIPAQVCIADASKPETWWDKQPFDIILVDAPCSATGVIRRHPDIKLLRRPEDIPQLAKTQLQILQALYPLLKPEGQLMYTTCSLLEEENDAVVANFLELEDKAQACELKLPIGQNTKHGWQILPSDHNCDGFYFCLIEPK